MELISRRTPLALLLISLGVIAAVWWWLATPINLTRAPIDPNAKLQCVSYAPFRGEQSPLSPATHVTPEQIAEDLAQLAKITDCIRTYSTDNGLDQIPEFAAKVGLKVTQGIWLSSNRQRNLARISTTLKLVREYPSTITALVVGNEVLLRGEMTVSDLAATIRSVKAQVSIPVTYADVWEYWLRNREIYDAVDFVTIHILPYWEDFPVRAKLATAHVDSIRRRMAVAFPGKEILIGETGWPSEGRMRDAALPSRTNQARVVAEILELAKRENFRVNLIEAYDQPWKRQLEGTVGGYWGLFDSARRLKYPPGEAISNFPLWKWQMGLGLAASLIVFGSAWLTTRRRPWTPRLSSWIAVGLSATSAGILIGVAADKMFYESYGIGGWLQWGALLAAGLLSPVLSANAVVSGRSLPTFLDLFGPRGAGESLSLSMTCLGAALVVAALIGSETALGFVFDPRYRDFPYAALTMAVVPFATLMLNRPQTGRRPLAEAVFAGLLAGSAIFIGANEGRENWQSMWTCAIYLLFAITLWQARAAQSPK